SPAKGAGGPRVPRTARQKATSAPRRGMERTVTVGRCCGARSCWKSWRPVDDLRKTSATWVGPVATRRADAAGRVRTIRLTEAEAHLSRLLCELHSRLNCKESK